VLSHGQQQWLEIGMAVGVEPSLLLLDEPTAGMSPDETRKTGEMLRELNTQGMTILAVEHDMAFVQQIAERVTVLHFGAIFAQGSVPRSSPTPVWRTSIWEPPMSDAAEGHGPARGYGGEPVLQGVDMRDRQGRDRRRDRPQRGRQEHPDAHADRAPAGGGGKIRFAGQEVNGRPPTGPRPDRDRLHPAGARRVPAADRAGEPARGRGRRRGRRPPDYERVYELLPDPEGARRQAAGTLSGGQQQQLAIGRAMVGGPDLMLLDEPSEGIQPSIVKDIARNVRRLNERPGLTVLFVEQNLDLIVSSPSAAS
jgi:ABC-type branched-subunit amino acid transport system ATPase component